MTLYRTVVGKWFLLVAAFAFTTATGLEPILHASAGLGSALSASLVGADSPVDDDNTIPLDHDGSRCVPCEAGAVALPAADTFTAVPSPPFLLATDHASGALPLQFASDPSRARGPPDLQPLAGRSPRVSRS